MPGRPDPRAEERALLEGANGLAQFEFIERTVVAAAARGPSVLSLELLQLLNQIALKDLDGRAGQLRTGPILITNSEHRPPPPDVLGRELDEVFQYLEREWDVAPATRLAAYAMWRLNWIHPFWDGNGRTSRAAGYIVICVRLGYLLPGSDTILTMLAANKRGYIEALEDADAAWRGGRVNVSTMDRLLSRYLARQLASAADATEGDHP